MGIERKKDHPNIYFGPEVNFFFFSLTQKCKKGDLKESKPSKL
jgi:hypothetical protein